MQPSEKDWVKGRPLGKGMAVVIKQSFASNEVLGDGGIFGGVFAEARTQLRRGHINQSSCYESEEKQKKSELQAGNLKFNYVIPTVHAAMIPPNDEVFS